MSGRSSASGETSGARTGRSSKGSFGAARARAKPSNGVAGRTRTTDDVLVKRSAPALDVDFESIGELIPQLVWVSNSAGEAVYFNQAWYAYTGQIPVDALPDGWTNAVHPEDFGPTVAAWRSSVAFGTPYDVEYRLRDDDGRYRWFVARGQPLRALDGSIVRWFGTSTDIEDRKVAESLLRERFERDHRVLGILQSAMQPDLPRVAAVRCGSTRCTGRPTTMPRSAGTGTTPSRSETAGSSSPSAT